MPRTLPFFFGLNRAERLTRLDRLDKKFKAIVWELKYKENTRALDFIGKIIFEEIIALMSDIILFDAVAEFVLIPIPISSERRALRGFNQSEYIAKAILEHDIGRKLLY